MRICNAKYMECLLWIANPYIQDIRIANSNRRANYLKLFLDLLYSFLKIRIFFLNLHQKPN